MLQYCSVLKQHKMTMTVVLLQQAVMEEMIQKQNCPYFSSESWLNAINLRLECTNNCIGCAELWTCRAEALYKWPWTLYLAKRFQVIHKPLHRKEIFSATVKFYKAFGQLQAIVIKGVIKGQASIAWQFFINYKSISMHSFIFFFLLFQEFTTALKLNHLPYLL